MLGMKTQELFVRSDGTIQVIGDAPQELAGMGERVCNRASNILPVRRGKRAMFLLLRLLFGERGRVAEFTRRWQGPWIAMLFATGETYMHQSRLCCLDWEHRRLNQILSTQ